MRPQLLKSFSESKIKEKIKLVKKFSFLVSKSRVFLKAKKRIWHLKIIKTLILSTSFAF